MDTLLACPTLFWFIERTDENLDAGGFTVRDTLQSVPWLALPTTVIGSIGPRALIRF